MDKPIKFKKNLILKRIIFIVMILATFFTIFNFSSQNAKQSGTISKKVTTAIVRIVIKDEATVTRYVKKLEPKVRKLAHYSIYILVGFSVMGLFCTFDIKNKYKVLFSLLIGVAYAASDELHQKFTPRSWTKFNGCRNRLVWSYNWYLYNDSTGYIFRKPFKLV